jgi:hypothetical protein
MLPRVGERVLRAQPSHRRGTKPLGASSGDDRRAPAGRRKARAVLIERRIFSFGDEIEIAGRFFEGADLDTRAGRQEDVTGVMRGRGHRSQHRSGGRRATYGGEPGKTPFHWELLPLFLAGVMTARQGLPDAPVPQ